MAFVNLTATSIDEPEADYQPLSKESDGPEAVALAAADEAIWELRSRIRAEPNFATSLVPLIRQILDAFSPFEAGSDSVAWLDAVFRSIESVPNGQLCFLKRKIERNAEAADTDAVRRASLLLVMGWIGTRVVEITGEEPYRKAARQLRADHELLFTRLLMGRWG